MARSFIAGGAGFIGSHVVDHLLTHSDDDVVVFDNLSSGDEDHLKDHLGNERLSLVVGDLQDLDAVCDATAGADRMFLFAANPDIAKAVTEPTIDFWQGTYLASNAIEAARRAGISQIVYSSGSGVYGDRGAEAVAEDAGAMRPISTYGASKLGCEALLSSYTHMFGLSAVVFRFANVVGPGQTHGVTYDFVRRLIEDPTRLQILGDGRQSKSYIHVADVVDAMMMLSEARSPGFDVFNAGTLDYVSVTDIADLCCERLGLRDVSYEFSGGDRGWKGDVPVVRFNSDKLRARGWRNARTSREALVDAIDHAIAEVTAATHA
jgi:UDP-glucose 4-epimerase